MAVVPCLRYTDPKQVKQKKQHGNEKEAGQMYPRSGGTGKNTPFAEQSKEKERDKGHKTI